MHLFFDTVLKLHIGEIPEKPEHDILKLNTWVAQRNYDLAIAAIKQNALTVGNHEVIKSKLDSLEWVGRLDKADVYKWPGGYEMKEKELWTSEREPASCFTTVAILTLPEEKKNTMEISEFKCMTCSTAITKGEYDTFGVCDACYNANYKKQTEASGSVAAPTWYTENEMYHWLIRNNYHENIARELSSKWAADLQGAFNKGFEKGTREIKEREEALKEFAQILLDYKHSGVEVNIDYLLDKFPYENIKGKI